MERVKKGEKYWYINTNAAITAMWVDWDMEGNYPSIDTTRFENGNYFHTCAEAEQMASKLRAVLKGAEVIEMPSEEEICNQCQMEWIANDGSIGDKRIFNDIVLTAYSVIKSKIVK